VARLQANFHQKVALVTGASRGVGAAVARLLSERGADGVINFRSKGRRAEEVAAQVRSHGRRAVLAQADLTSSGDLQAMVQLVAQTFGRLDVLVLNASGGLEREKPADYAMQLNNAAQIRTVDALLPLMPSGSCIVFVTSLWAHFYGQEPVIPAYEPVAASKKAGEDALLARLPEFTGRGVRLGIVGGDMIEGTTTLKLLERAQPGVVAARRNQVGVLPSIEEFAQVIVDVAADSKQPSGQVVLVGPTG